MKPSVSQSPQPRRRISAARPFYFIIALLFTALIFASGAGAKLKAAFFQDGDIGVTKTGPDTAAVNTDIVYTITVSTLGPDDVSSAQLLDNLAAGTTFVSLSKPASWSCTDPGVGNGGQVNCTNATVPAGTNDVFTLTVHIGPEVPPGTFITNVANVTGSPDNDEENDSSAASTLIPGPEADVGVLKSANPINTVPDRDVTFTITVFNSGPDAADSASLADTLPGDMTFVSLSSPAGWSCTTPSVGTGGMINCSKLSLAVTNGETFTLVGHIPPISPGPTGTTYVNTADVSSTTEDPNGENNSSTASTTALGCLTAVQVTTNADSGAGSLRQAIMDACDGATITFDMNQVVSPISLTSDELAINKGLTISGPGAGILTVQRSTDLGTPNFRVFEIGSGSFTVNISGLTISSGHPPNGAASSDAPSGGGILNNPTATLNLDSVIVSGNSTGAAGSGGGFYGGFGGGIANLGSLTLTNSTVTNNQTGSGTSDGDFGGFGGGISNGGFSSNPGTLTIRNSTINNNQSGASSLDGGSGGGISNNAGSSVTIQNSTINGNIAGSGATGGKGGGIYNAAGVSGGVNLINATISANQSGGGSIGGDGGGVFNGAGTVTLRNTIIAGNTVAAGGQGPDLAGMYNSNDNNLFGDATGATITGATSHNILNQDAKLGLLANNGGPTQTQALLAGSPALDAGDNCVTDSAHCGDANVSQLVTDQRGEAFARSVDGPDADTTATVDIGAFEAQVSVEDITDKTTNEDTQLQFTFNVGGNVQTLTATSSNTTLVPNDPANIAVSGSGSVRTLTINPAANLSGTSTITITVADNNGQSMTDTFLLTVNSSNDAPTFTRGPDQTVNEDAGPQMVSNWATNMSPGPSDEAGQALTFVVTNNTNPGLFSAGPAVDSGTGTLTYTPAANANGAATITIVLMDNGGTMNGGQDTSAPQTFTITVNSVNDAPSFTKGPDQTINEDAGTQTVTNWATNISVGPANESGQVPTFMVTGNSNPSLFSTAPAISSTGTLSYTPAANANGTASITIVLKDDGGTANGGQDTSLPQGFAITVNSVNDPPSFTKGPDQTVVLNAGAQTVTNWATNISAGPSNESGEAVFFQVTGNTNSALFSVPPSISSTGTLTYTPATNVSGSATITINLKDNGGTANGGVDTSPSQTFTITVSCGSTVVINSNDSGAGSLRDTILHACAGSTITFQAGLSNVTLTSGELLLEKSLAVQGPGANVLTVQRSAAAGTPLFRIFNIPSASTTASISGLTLSNADSAELGGAINNAGTLTMDSVTLSGNHTSTAGAAIHNEDTGTLTLTNGTLSGNRSDEAGGAIYNHDGILNLTNSTLTGNMIQGNGPGTAVFSEANTSVTNITNCTISQNTGMEEAVSQNPGGAGKINLKNTIVSGNTGGDVSGATDNGNNLIGGNALLGAFGNYGGPTQTIALLPGSPAINAGTATGAPATDQRGVSRVGAVDIGSFESRGFTISAASGTPQSATILSAFASPLVASIAAVAPEPVDGGVIIFTAPPASASAALTGGGAIAKVTIAGGQASTNATANGIAGSYNVSASASGATSASFALTNNKAATTITITSSLNPSDLNQNVTFTAKVTSVAILTGTVQFKDNGNNLGAPVALNSGGVAKLTTSSLTTGNHSITADYSGDANFLPSSSTLPNGQTVLFRPTIKFSQPNYSVNENGNFITITVVRSGDTSQAVSVDYATPDDSAAMTFVPCSTANGVASPRCDFTTALGTLNFGPGETSKTFTVLISQDLWVEGDETVALTLSNPTGGAAFQQPSDANAVLTIVDDDLTPPTTNAIDNSDTFVRQHYHDFLNREPDSTGLNFWINQIESCGTDAQCRAMKRVNVSAAFFLSIEFQNTGYFVERMYKAGFGDINSPPVPVPLRFTNFLRDTQDIRGDVIVGVGNWQAQIEAAKKAYALAFVQRTAFLNRYPALTSATAFVDSLNANAGMVLSDAERSALITELSPNPSDPALRADVLQKVAENALLQQREFNRAFVLMQYFGYLRRNPDAAPEPTLNFDGYNFWLNKLNQFNGDYVGAELIKAFITSGEYRGRFGP